MKSNVTKSDMFRTLLLGVACSSLLYTAQSLWDLGVVIDKDLKIISQQEIDIQNINNISINTQTQKKKNIKALHSNNFIKPILKEIKHPLINDINIIKKYDEIINKLSLKDKIVHIKKAFLKKEYTKFSKIYNLINKENRPPPRQLELMNIQNLYYANKFKEAKKELSKLNSNNISDELLLYAIKINIKLNEIEKAQSGIKIFIEKYSESDFLPYIIYEKKLLEQHDQ